MSSNSAAAPLFIVDAHSLIFQVFHAIAQMTSPKGLPTNAVFGFARDLLFLRNEKKPLYLLCAFDRSEPTFRDQLFAQYKANRSPMPEDLRTQIPLIHQLLEAMRIPLLSHQGYEADDVIATVARAAAERGLDVYICSADKDCRQLIGERVRIFNLRKKEVFDSEGLLRDWGVRPEQVIDLQALVGDSIDNVPGVPGIGIKTASKLLIEYGTLENLLANIDKLSGAKMKENLLASKEKLQLGRTLVRLATDVPMQFDWEGWRLGPPDYDRLLELFQEWGFNRFTDQIRQERRAHVPERQGELFPRAGLDEPGLVGAVPVKASWIATYHLVDSSDKLKSFLTALRNVKRFAFDLETTSPQPRGAEIVGIAFSWQAQEGWYLPVRGPADTSVLNLNEILPEVRPIFEDAGIAKVNQNIKYDLLVLRNYGIRAAGVAGDTMVADYLLHAGERSHSLEDLSNRYLNHQVIPVAALLGKKSKRQVTIDQVPTAYVAEYAGEEVDVAWRLCELLEPKLQAAKLHRLYADLEIPLIEVLGEMEYNGVRLDLALLDRLSRDMTAQLDDIESQIHRLAGRSFNIASPQQLREVLFKELKLPTQRRTGITGEASTAQETLERLAALGHELPRKIVEHRRIAKLKGTYVDALPGLVNPATGRIHASFNQTVTSTGRLSSSDPNLQNIPIRTEQGRQIRQAFVPEPGWVLITADYSQIELRLLAHFSGDETLSRAFAVDHDIHALVAGQIFGVPAKEATAEMRRVAKMVNFGVLYGMSAHGLAQRLEMPLDDAAKFIAAYFGRYPKVAGYQAELLRRCREDRCVATILGRRREISGIRASSTYEQRNQPEREAINMQVQGSAADLIKVAMLNIHRRLKRETRQARMLLQIHDELVFEAPPREEKVVAALVKDEMTSALKLNVPLKVDIASGPNWLDVNEVAF
jgi:DNA polymerase-1